MTTIERFIHGGGLEKRLKEQSALIAELKLIGIQFGDFAQLIDCILYAGDWRKIFVQLAIQGRPLGIQFTGRNINQYRVSSALSVAGFSHEQITRVLSNIVEPISESSQV